MKAFSPVHPASTADPLTLSPELGLRPVRCVVSARQQLRDLLSGQTAGKASLCSAGNRRERARPVNLTLERTPKEIFQPLRDREKGVEIDAGFDALAVEQVDEVLGRDVPGRTRCERAAPDAPDRGVEHAGARFRRAAYPYLNTVTCAGHASIGTGTVPAVHGIVLNAWWDRATQTYVSCTDDPAHPDLGYNGLTTKKGDSAARLLVPIMAR